jgi:hypothetical protein
VIKRRPLPAGMTGAEAAAGPPRQAVEPHGVIP